MTETEVRILKELESIRASLNGLSKLVLTKVDGSAMRRLRERNARLLAQKIQLKQERDELVKFR